MLNCQRQGSHDFPVNIETIKNLPILTNAKKLELFSRVHQLPKRSCKIFCRNCRTFTVKNQNTNGLTINSQKLKDSLLHCTVKHHPDPYVFILDTDASDKCKGERCVKFKMEFRKLCFSSKVFTPQQGKY